MRTSNFLRLLAVIGLACLQSGCVFPVSENVSLEAAPPLPPNESSMNQTSGEKSGRVEIRIRNGSEMDFDEVRVHFPDQRDVDYGPVPRGGVTAFQAATRAYRYAGFSVKAG